MFTSGKQDDNHKNEQKDEANQSSVSVSSVSSAALTPNDTAAQRAAQMFAGYDAKQGQTDDAKKNPYPFAITTSAAADIAHLVPNSYLFVKEPGQRWRQYHINIIAGKKEKVLKDINEIAGLEEVLNANEFNVEAYGRIAATLDAAKKKDEIVKKLREIIDTERTFIRVMKEFVNRIDNIYPDLDPATQRKLDVFMLPYRSFVDPFAGFDHASVQGRHQEEQIAIYEKVILSGFNSDAMENNVRAYFDVTPHSAKFNAFLGEKVLHGHARNSMYEIDERVIGEVKAKILTQKGSPTAEQNLSLESLRIKAVQRFPQYFLFLRDAAKIVPDPKAITALINKLSPVGERLNIATSKESDVTRLLLAKRAASTIINEIRLLQGSGVNIDARMFDNAITELHSLGHIERIRDRLKTDLVQLYARSYLEYRFKGYITTDKRAQLKALEKFIVNIEKAFEDAGIHPLLVDRAVDLDAAGKANREEVIFASVNSLPDNKFKEIINDLYEQGKLIVMKLVATSDAKEIEKIKENFANVFKALQKIGTKAKAEWNNLVIARAEANAEDFKYRSVFEIPREPKDFVNGKLSEDHAKDVFKANTELFKMKFATISPVSESTSSESKADEKVENEEEYVDASAVHRASVVEQTGPLMQYSGDVTAQCMLKREIQGILAAQILSAKGRAIALGFDQFQIFEKLAERVNDKFVLDAAREGMLADLSAAEAGRVIPDALDARETAKIFYADLIRAYVDACVLQSGAKDSLLPILRDLIVNFDTAMQGLSNKFDQKGGGVTMNGFIFKDRRPTVTNLDAAVLGSIVPPTASSHDFPPLGNELINHLFETVVNLVNHRPQGEYERLAFRNALAVVMQMGVPAARAWNARAARDFYELTIVSIDQNHAASQKLLNSFDAVSALSSTEAQRRDDLVRLACECFTESVKGLSEEEFPARSRVEAIQSLMRANHAGLRDRNELRQNLQVAIYNIHNKAYSEGRKKTGFIFKESDATPYLASIVDFIKTFDQELAARGQRPIIIDDVRLYKNKPITNANLIWSQTEAAFGRDGFHHYIEQLFNAVVANFEEMNRNKMLIDGYTGIDGNQDNPYNRAVKNVVNTFKAIQRMCEDVEGNQVKGSAKDHWNQIADRFRQSDTARFERLGSFSRILFVSPLIVRAKDNQIHEEEIKDAFKGLVDTEIKQRDLSKEVSAAFHQVKLILDSMMKNFDAKKAVDDYTKNIKKGNPFHDARKELVDILLAVHKKGGYAQGLWNELVTSLQVELYGKFCQVMSLNAGTSEDSIKLSFMGVLKELSDIHARSDAHAKQGFFKASTAATSSATSSNTHELKEKETSAQRTSTSRPRTPTSGTDQQ